MTEVKERLLGAVGAAQAVGHPIPIQASGQATGGGAYPASTAGGAAGWRPNQ